MCETKYEYWYNAFGLLRSCSFERLPKTNITFDNVFHIQNIHKQFLIIHTILVDNTDRFASFLKIISTSFLIEHKVNIFGQFIRENV